MWCTFVYNFRRRYKAHTYTSYDMEPVRPSFWINEWKIRKKKKCIIHAYDRFCNIWVGNTQYFSFRTGFMTSSIIHAFTTPNRQKPIKFLVLKYVLVGYLYSDFAVTDCVPVDEYYVGISLCFTFRNLVYSCHNILFVVVQVCLKMLSRKLWLIFN